MDWAARVVMEAEEQPISRRQAVSLEEEVERQAEELAGVREDVAHIREDVAGLGSRVTTDLAAMRGLLNQLISEQPGRPRRRARGPIENAGS
jgi:hypothetical protein